MADSASVLAIPMPTGTDDRSQAEALAKRYCAEFVDLKNFKIQHDLLRTVPVELMFRYNFVPIEQQNEALVIAVSDPSQLMVIDEIAGLLSHRIIPRVATLSQITELLKKTEQSQRVLDEASEGLTFDVLSADDNSDENISIEKLTSEEDISPIIRLVDTTIFTALERRASDIHIETNDDSVVVKYRIDGVLQAAMAPIAREHHSTILSRIKIMSELDIAERRVPQDGRFRVRYKGRLIDFRVSIMPTVHGENAVLRVLDKESMSEKFHKLTLDVVGFSDDDLRKFRRYIKEPYGMVLVTGPTGSGKTTTLYAALNEIKTDEDKLITIEDPVEYQIRGTETAQIAINSALTGHLVFTTVHANNVVDVLGRFLNMGVEAYNFVSALNCILAQRLVRLICEFCKKEVHYSDAELEASGLNPQEWASVPFYEGDGCIECSGTGFRGRSAIHELLELTDNVREMILAKRPSSEIRRAARDEGMHFLRESAIDRVKRGLTTLKEINKVTFIETTR